MVAKTLLICFIPEINKSQLAIVDTDALSDNEVNGPVANIKNVNEKVHETSWNTSKISEKHGKNTLFAFGCEVSLYQIRCMYWESPGFHYPLCTVPIITP